MADIDERFAAYVRDRGEHHLRVAVLLTSDWHAAVTVTPPPADQTFSGP
jgi:hypothetical protein